MTVRVRLQRFGRRNRPFYRVVVADSRSPRDGKFIELVGTYNPLATRSGVKEVRFNVDRIRYWVSVGAQPSDRVAWLLGQFGVLPPKVVPVARTKQTVPRKQWKDMQKNAGKGIHSYAAASPPTLSIPTAGGCAAISSVMPTIARCGATSFGQSAAALPTVGVPVGWGTGAGAGTPPTKSVRAGTRGVFVGGSSPIVRNASFLGNPWQHAAPAPGGAWVVAEEEGWKGVGHGAGVMGGASYVAGSLGLAPQEGVPPCRSSTNTCTVASVLSGNVLRQLGPSAWSLVGYCR